jgi:hypothetical protein
MGQGASQETAVPVSPVVVSPLKPESDAAEGDFAVRYGGDLQDIVAGTTGGGAEADKEALHAKMQQAYEAGMRDSTTDNAAAQSKYKLSIIGEFQKEIETMQQTHAATATSLAKNVEQKLVQVEKTDRCTGEEQDITACYVANKGNPLVCADLVAAYQKCIH